MPSPDPPFSIGWILLHPSSVQGLPQWQNGETKKQKAATPVTKKLVGKVSSCENLCL
jgi:hypothetical protein